MDNRLGFRWSLQQPRRSRCRSGATVRVVGDLVWQHYEAQWGHPDRVAEFRRSGEAPVRIGKWSPERNGEGVTIYATDGVSVDRGGTRRTHGYEVILGLSPEDDACASPLAALATQARSEGLGPGHTIQADGPLWPGVGMTAWLLDTQAVEILPALVAG